MGHEWRMHELADASMQNTKGMGLGKLFVDSW